MLKTNGHRRGFWLPELDILRFFAFLWVFTFHGPMSHPSFFEKRGFSPDMAGVLTAFMQGWGVDVFFCLSAYLITELLRREYVRTGKIDVRAFWTRRILRIWPLYFFLVLFVFFVAAWVIPSGPLKALPFIAYLTFTVNWFMALDLGLFPYHVAMLITPLWSISMEEQFYLTWPLVFNWMQLKRHRFWIVCAILLTAATVMRLALVSFDVQAVNPWWFNPLVRIDSIVLGAAAAITLNGRLPRFAPWVRVGLVLISIAGFWFVAYGDHRASPHGLWAYPLAGLSTLGVLLATLNAPLPDSPVTRGLSFLGRISYGLYAWHPIGYYLVMLYLQDDSTLLYWFLSLILTTVLAVCSWLLLEKPFLSLKQRFTRAGDATTGTAIAASARPVLRAYGPHIVGLFTLVALLATTLAKPVFQPLSLNYGDSVELIGYHLKEKRVDKAWSLVEVHTLFRSIKPLPKAYRLQADVFDVNGTSLELQPQPHSIIDGHKWSLGEVQSAAAFFIYEPKLPVPFIGHIQLSLVDPDTGQTLPLRCTASECNPRFGELHFMNELATTQPWQNQPSLYRIGDRIDVLAVTTAQAARVGTTLTVDLVWRTRQTPSVLWVSFIHVLDERGTLVAQSQAPAITTRFPTTVWQPGDVILGQVNVDIPASLPKGNYHVHYGMYVLDSVERLSIQPLVGGKVQDNLIDLGMVEVH